MAEMG